MTLEGKKIAILIAPRGTEEPEFTEPKEAVEAAGASVTVTPDIIVIRHLNLTDTWGSRRDDTVYGIRGGKRTAQIRWLRCHAQNLPERRSYDIVRAGTASGQLPEESA